MAGMKLITAFRRMLGLLRQTSVESVKGRKGRDVVGSQAFDDWLQSHVKKRLRADDQIDWRELNVHVEEGRVRLYGLVRTRKEKIWAQAAAASVPGIGALFNHIIVQSCFETTEEVPVQAKSGHRSPDAVLKA